MNSSSNSGKLYTFDLYDVLNQHFKVIRFKTSIFIIFYLMIDGENAAAATEPQQNRKNTTTGYVKFMKSVSVSLNRFL